MEDLGRKLRLLKEEDIIWYIYFFIVAFALIANKFEENYVYTGNKNDRQRGRNINITLLVVAFIIYLYYTILAMEDISIEAFSDQRRKRVAIERLITTLVFLAGGALSIYTELDDNAGDVDLAIF